jgi:putative ABC transport system permease protein
MNAIRLSLAFLRRRWGQALLSIVVGALGIAAVETMFIAEREIPEAAQRAFGGVDLVIGPKGSALDLVLCCALHVSEPRGLVPLDAGMALTRNPFIRAAAPIALGDNIRGWRIVGTTPEILSVYGAKLAQGNMWTVPLQAIAGAEVARSLGLKVGDAFVGAHGLGSGGEEHTAFPYKVVGLLAPTGSALDRIVLTDIQSVYVIHQHHEVGEAEEDVAPTADAPPAATAILVAFRSPIAMAALPRLIDATPQFSAASPAIETARLIRAARPMITATIVLGLIFAGIAAATAATALLAAMSARAKDLALLRALGAHPWEIGRIAAIEAALLSLAAAVLGCILAVGLIQFGATLFAERDGLLLTGVPAAQDFAWIFGGAFAVSLIAATVPAIRAARAPIETVLDA